MHIVTILNYFRIGVSEWDGKGRANLYSNGFLIVSHTGNHDDDDVDEEMMIVMMLMLMMLMKR
jgi:hypothetical protein